MNTSHFKTKLLEEKETLERELLTVGRRNPDTPGDWQPTPPPIDVQWADPSEVAEEGEEFEGRNAVETELEERLNEITDALTRIESNTYGTCTVCNEPIEEARLEANPAATTCMAHLNG